MSLNGVRFSILWFVYTLKLKKRVIEVMLNEFNIYCDESCHLENDNSDIMLIGGLLCPKEKVKEVSQEIKEIKLKHGMKSDFEIKWTKVSPAKIDFYRELIEYYWQNPYLQFRCVIATNKKLLNNSLYNQTYDDWYYKIYYLLLSKMIDPMQHYNVYIDIKDTRGGARVSKLQTIINNFLYKFSSDCLRNIQQIRSHESSLLQLSDLLIGAVGYKNRFLKEYLKSDETISPAKISLCNLLSEYTNRTLIHSTPLTEDKFNLFVWKPKEEQ